MANEKRQDSAGYRNYFGFDDGADEKNLAKIFVQMPEFKDIKLSAKDIGHVMITGLKGTGKTALCRYIASTEPHSLLWRVDNEKRFINVHAKELGSYPPEVEFVLLNLILSEVSRQIIA
jgi:ABC-type phosphate/phosphonate transport system ATPase subunit